MDFLKKSFIALTIFGITLSTHAGTLTGAFVGLNALNLEPRTGDLDFIHVNPLVAGPINVYSIRPSYSWAFELYAGLNFCNNEDITVDWLRDHTSFNHDFPSPVGGTLGLPRATDIRWLTLDSWANIGNRLSFDIDDVYGVYGHTIEMNPWSIRYAAGVNWVELNSSMSDFALAVPGNDLQPFNLLLGYKAKSHFTGTGPRVEFDFNYMLPYDFGLFAKTNAVLFIGKRYDSLEAQQDVVPAVLVDFTYDRHFVMIPKLGLRLGVNKTYLFDQSFVGFEAGWATATYIHILDRPIGFNNIGINLNALNNIRTRVSNYSYQGWFAGIKFGGPWL